MYIRGRAWHALHSWALPASPVSNNHYSSGDNCSERGETKSSRLDLEEGMGLLQAEGRESAVSGLGIEMGVTCSGDFQSL